MHSNSAGPWQTSQQVRQSFTPSTSLRPVFPPNKKALEKDPLKRPYKKDRTPIKKAFKKYRIGYSKALNRPLKGIKKALNKDSKKD